MPMMPFFTRFRELAARETRCLYALQPGGELPPGEYDFIELYCNEGNCDCRRVLIQVLSPPNLRDVLATINYGWESTDFYTRWMHDDEQAGREITAASLDPLNTQSPLAPALLDVFRREILTDSAYVARLAGHYAIFKRTQQIQPGGPDHVSGGAARPGRSAAPRVDRNEPCPCGSGKKYKTCCGKN